MNNEKIIFSRSDKKSIEGTFAGGNITQDAGLLLVKEMDKKLGLTKLISNQIKEKRNVNYIKHTIDNMIAQRVYSIAGGYEDLNDHDAIRKDIHF